MTNAIKLATAQQAKVAAIRAAILNTVGSVHDDHNNGREFSTFKQFALLKQGEKLNVCPLPSEAYSGSRFIISLNPLYMDKGEVHLDRWSISTFDQNGSDLEAAVASYNAEHIGNRWDDAEIIEIIKV